MAEFTLASFAPIRLDRPLSSDEVVQMVIGDAAPLLQWTRILDRRPANLHLTVAVVVADCGTEAPGAGRQ